MKSKQFYFNEVNLSREENPHGLLDFELLSTHILKLFVDGTKKLSKSSISLTKRETNFPDTVKWDIYNDSINRITLRVEMLDKSGNVLNGFWMPLAPLTTNNIILNNIPGTTQKLILICYHENVINKSATLTVTAKN